MDKLRNKAEKMKVLTKDLVKYSEQIGLNPIPRMVFTPKDWDEIVKSKRRTKRNRWLGMSCRYYNTILVNLEFTGVVKQLEFKADNRRVIVQTKWNLANARNTLVHELVHMRWRIPHGYRFAKRMDEILKGKRFPLIEK